MKSYQEQLDRTKRWHDRFREITDGRKHDHPTEFARDDAYAFFQNCHHIKDWIIQDSAVLIDEKADVAEQFINNSRALSLCADLCNATKHMALTKPPRSGDRPEIESAHFGLDLATGVLSVRYSISTLSGTLDAFDLASECLSEWHRFLKEQIIAQRAED